MKRLLTSIAVGMLTFAAYAQWSNPVEDVPAYHATAPAPGVALPPLLSGSQLTGPNFTHPWQKAIYRDVAPIKVQKILYQLPCFCRCDRALGHQSLHSCFEGLHGAECSTCAKEGYYAYEMSKQGKTAKQIRDGIMHKDFEKIDLNSIGM
ncbi:MAG TPA: PCYCGC motif-containing (lipo)protein [Acidobacteriaceae bacterium]|nr:PCYCGC motif-containing (lipo)protein [Acidobacteriaceae bacterium]